MVDGETVLELKVRLCALNVSWLPNEVRILDAGKQLEDSAPACEKLSALWCEEDRSSSSTWTRAMYLFAKFGNETGAVRCASEMLANHAASVNAHFQAFHSVYSDATDLHIVNAYISAGMDPAHFGNKLVTVAEFGDIDITHALLLAAADANVRDPSGATPLFISSENGHIDIVRALLAAQADVNILEERGRSPLFTSSISGHIAVVQVLLDAMADANLADNTGQTPLYMPSFMGRLDVVRALLASKADGNIAAHNGKTPLDMSVLSGHMEIASVLRGEEFAGRW